MRLVIVNAHIIFYSRYFSAFLAIVVTMLLNCNPDQDSTVSTDILHLQIECTESALRSALDSISNQGGGKITFKSEHDTVDISDRIYFYGNNLVLDGSQQEIVLRYTGPDDCSQTEGLDHFIEIHGNNNKISNFTLLGFPDGIHIQSGNENVVENIKFPYICEDAVTNNGRGYEAFGTVIQNCYFEGSEDKAVMINNGGSVVIKDCEFVNCAQPVRAGGKYGEYVIKDCTFKGTSTGPRFSGGRDGLIVFFEKNKIEDAKYGIRIYGSVQAMIRDNTCRSVQYGVYAYEKAKIRMEKNDVQGSQRIGVLLEDSVRADLGGGLVAIKGDTTASKGMNILKDNKIKDLVNNTPFMVKAENNIWDHELLTEILTEDVYGPVDIEPLYQSN
jgi:hypothetical protein